MSSMRIAMITRRFWPMVGGAEVVMANLAEEFRRAGCQPTILTAQWETAWPREMVHREVPVVRLPQPMRRAWGTYRYMANLGAWLRQNRDNYDIAFVSMLKHSAYVAVGTMRRSPIPVVLRAEGAGETGDCHWQNTARFGRRIRRRCQQADAVVAPSPAIVSELTEVGYDPARVHFVANGVSFRDVPRSPSRRDAAREALADVNHDLRVAENAPVIAYTGRLHVNKGLRELVDAFETIVRQIPNARLWLIGEGPYRDDLYDYIVQKELRGRVLLPGAFDFTDDVLAAADVFVLPSYEEGMSLSLLEAMAAELPVVATAIAGNEQLVSHEENGLLVPVREVQPLCQAICRVLQSEELANRLGQAASQFSRATFSSQRMAADHLELFQRLRKAKR